MENQTAFDLNTAMETWREELLAQAHLTPDDRRELEHHLRDTVAELRGRGLNEEESFWLACQRAGEPRRIAVEFVKAHPARVWRERVLWMALALLMLELWSDVSFLLIGSARFVIREILLSIFPWTDTALAWRDVTWLVGGQWQWVYLVMSFMPLLFLAVSISNGRMARMAAWGRKWIHSRARFVFAAAIAISVVWLLTLGADLQSLHIHDPAERFRFETNFLLASLWNFALVALVAWLMPGKDRTTPKLA